jgi:hypothetical protein
MRGETLLEFTLPEASTIRLTVFDVAGREVERVRDGRLTAGPHTVPWRPQADLPAGVYFAALKAARIERVQRFVVVR